MRDQHLRVGDAEREAAAARLADHYAEGRISTEEHSERLDRIWAARTRGELGLVFNDLPGQQAPPSPAFRLPPRAQQHSPQRPVRRGMPTPVVALLAVLLLVTVVTHLPLILLGVAIWFLLASRHGPHLGRRYRHRGWQRTWSG